MRFFSQLIAVLLPWPLKRFWLRRFFGYDLHPTAHLGLAWVYPGHLSMGPGSRIDHFTVAIHLEEMMLGKNALIGRSNWITGHRTSGDSLHFRHQPDRASLLSVGEESAITKGHHIDCTHRVEIGSFTTVAGYRSQILTHSIDVRKGRQHGEAIRIGDYCFLGTSVIVLGGGVLPSYSVLGAGSLLHRTFEEQWSLYAGVPATRKGTIDREAKYFLREKGFVE